MEPKIYQNNNDRMAHCDCGTPLVKRLDSRKFEFVKYHQGQSSKTLLEYSGNDCKVICKKCGRSFTFMTNVIPLGLSYIVAIPKSKSPEST